MWDSNFSEPEREAAVDDIGLRVKVANQPTIPAALVESPCTLAASHLMYLLLCFSALVLFWKLQEAHSLHIGEQLGSVG